MNAWDETWDNDAGSIELVGTEAPFGPVIVKQVGKFWTDAGDRDAHEKRGKLAAAAPALARALRDAEVMIDKCIQHCEGAEAPSELSMKDVHAKVLDAMEKAGMCS